MKSFISTLEKTLQAHYSGLHRDGVLSQYDSFILSLNDFMQGLERLSLYDKRDVALSAFSQTPINN